MTREIRPAQQDLVNHLCNSLCRNLKPGELYSGAGWASMGIGKTGATLVTLENLTLMKEKVYPVLILGPLRVAKNVWPAEVELWRGYTSATVSAVIGSEKQRAEALRQKADIYTMNYENLPWLIKQLNGQWPFRLVVLDESTAMKNLRCWFQKSSTGEWFLNGRASDRGRALAKQIFDRRPMVIELTGTPSPNGLANLWGQMFVMDRGYRLGATFKAFSQRWFAPNPNGYGVSPLAHAQGEISARVKDICMTLDARDYYDIKEPVVMPVYVDLPKAVREKYREMEKKMFTIIKDNPIEAFNAGTRTNKCSQIANGAAYLGEDNGVDNKEWVEVHNEKIEALRSIEEEACGMPLMVVHFFKSDLARLKKAFPHAVVLDKKQKTIDDFNAGKIPMLLVGYGAGHGISLQHGTNICVIFGMTWDLETYQQVIERIGPVRQWQSGYDRPVFIYQILARNTIDEEMCDRQQSKKSVQDLLLEAAKRRG